MSPASAQTAATKLPVALLGLGGVGRAILQQLLSPPLSSKFNLFLIANSRKYLVRESFATDPEFDVATYASELDKRGLKADLNEMIAHIAKHHPSNAIVIDSTSSDEISKAYPKILSAGVHVITPNKKATSGSLKLYTQILDAQEKSSGKGKRYYGESTVGAGLPILSTLTDLVETGDKVKLIEGVFSGTLSYIFNEFSPVPDASKNGEGRKFSEVVKVAKELGYTEPDPRDDLSGTDVARKLTILSRLVAPQLSLSTLPEGYASVPTQSLVPAVLQDCQSKEEYLQRLEEGDEEMSKLKQEAESEGNVVRYVGVIDVQSGKVEAKLGKYPFDHPFATALKGSDNIISFHTQRYSPRPLLIQGAGAGADVTAMGVTADLLKIHRQYIHA